MGAADAAFDTPGVVTGNGKTLKNVYLKSSNGISSKKIDVDTPVRKDSGGGYPNPNDCKFYKFEFDPSIKMKSNVSLTFDFYFGTENCICMVDVDDWHFPNSRAITVSQGSDWQKYDPYKAPTTYTLTCTDNPKIKRKNQNFNYDYTIEGGTNKISWADLRIYASSKTWNKGTTNLPTDPIYTYKLITSGDKSDVTGSLSTDHDSKLSNGSSYKPALVFNDGKSTFITDDDLIIYTYQEPALEQVTIAKSVQRADEGNSFTFSGTNNKAFASFEFDFTTDFRIKLGSGSYSEWTSLGNVTSWNPSAASIRTLISKSYDNQTCTLQFRRYNPSASWASSNQPEKTLKVIYRPLKGVTSDIVTLRKNSSSGTSLTKGQVVSSDSNLSRNKC